MPRWIRVEDPDTRHQYDVHESAVPEGVTVLKDYPENEGLTAVPRPPKFRTDKGRSANTTKKE